MIHLQGIGTLRLKSIRQCCIIDNYIVICAGINFSDLPVSVMLSPPFTPTQYLQFVYVNFNFNVLVRRFLNAQNTDAYVLGAQKNHLDLTFL